MDTSKVKRMVVCAANYYVHDTVYHGQPRNIERGIVVAGHNHSSCFAILHYLFPDGCYKAKTIQGFITSDNHFVSREVAFKIATEAEQIFYKHGGSRQILYSEDLRPVPPERG